MIFAQSVNPRGLSPSYVGLGQFVVDPVAACRTAIQSGTMGDVRFLMLNAALIYHSIIRAFGGRGVSALFQERLAQIDAIADEAGAVAVNLPANVPFGSRIDQICAMIALAQTDAAQFSASPGVADALEKLFKAAGIVQTRIEAATRPRPPEPEPEPSPARSIIIPAMLTGALIAVIGTAYYLSRRR